MALGNKHIGPIVPPPPPPPPAINPCPNCPAPFPPLPPDWTDPSGRTPYAYAFTTDLILPVLTCRMQPGQPGQQISNYIPPSAGIMTQTSLFPCTWEGFAGSVTETFWFGPTCSGPIQLVLSGPFKVSMNRSSLIGYNVFITSPGGNSLFQTLPKPPELSCTIPAAAIVNGNVPAYNIIGLAGTASVTPIAPI